MASEWGKLNAGQVYGLLAVDLDRALAHANLSEHEQALMQAVREQSWGFSARRHRPSRDCPWPEATPCVLDLQALAAEWSVPCQRLYEARQRLLKSRMLLPLLGVPGALEVNKNAHEWVNPRTGDPRLSPAKLAYAASARTRRRRDASAPVFTPERESEQRSNVNGSNVQTLLTATFERSPVVTLSTSVDGSSPPPDPSCVAPRAGSDVRNLDPTGLDIKDPPQPPEGAVCVTDASGRERPWVGDLRPDPAALARAEAKAEALFHGCYFDAKVRQFATSYPLGWIERALEEAAAADKRVGWRYIHSILRRWQAEGGPPPPPRTGKGRPQPARSSGHAPPTGGYFVAPNLNGIGKD